MKRHLAVMIVVVLTTLVPIATLAMSHGDHSGHDSSSMNMKSDEHAGHGGNMEMQHHGSSMSGGHGGGGMQLIGEQTEAGVKATAKIMVYDADKAKMVNASHHLMVFFTDSTSGAKIGQGKVAVKVKGGHGEAKPVELMAMGDGFGADLRVELGHYTFEVGTKLKDGAKRSFSYEYMVK
mgnify:CR=1 FL=1